MKRSLFKWSIAPLVACTLLAPSALRAQAVLEQATGWFIEELMPGIVCIDGRGQIALKYEVHLVRNESEDPRLVGRTRAVNLDLSLNPDGTGTFSGVGCLEVGTWDPAGNFTRTDGVWDLKYEGVINADGTSEYKFSASGIGGSIDRLHLTATATRGASLADPYLFRGKITGPEK